MLYPKNKYQPEHFRTHEFFQLLHFCREEFGLFLEAYNPASVERRLLKMMDMLRVSSLPELQESLKGRTNPRQIFCNAFVANITQLFREPQSLLFLRSHIFELWRHQPKIRVWIAGCSTGEDVLSMAILLHEHQLLERTVIVASDINGQALKKAQHRSIDLAKFKEAEEAYRLVGGTCDLLDYGIRSQNKFTFHPGYTAQVQYLEQDLYQTHPLGPFDLVWCKNVLIYFQSNFQFRIIEHLTEPLKTKGFLILGEQESMGFSKQENRFRQADYPAKAYQKIW